MEKLPANTRPASESLLAAAHDVEAAIGDRVRTHRALTSCAQAIEYHLDTLSAQLRPGSPGIEPRLRPAAERLETELQGILTSCWTAEQRLTAGEDVATVPLPELVSRVRHAASKDLDMVFEALRATGTAG